jgi:glutaredoxin
MEMILYHRWHCPYSKRVRHFIEENNLQSQIEYHEVEEAFDDMERLARLTGGQQTPCLVVDGRPKLDADRIIGWIQGNLLQGDQVNL